MTAPFHPPPPPKSQPEVHSWDPPPPTAADLDWASLHTISLSDLDSPDPSIVSSLISTTKHAIKSDGFLYVTDYGVSLAQLHRQFSLAQYLHANISAADKERLLWDPSTGSFAGWKPMTGWKREAGKWDGIEQFNFYSTEFDDPSNRVPSCIQPFMPEIQSFCEYLTGSVTRRLMALLSRVLEFPDDDYLWTHVASRPEDGHGSVLGEGYFRHALFHPLDTEAKRLDRHDIRMYGHRDYGTITLLFSVPITALHVFCIDKKWRPVKYKPGALVVNLGEGLEILSGGHFKATLHKVADTPPDQREYERLSLVLFNASRGDLRLKPAIEDSGLLQREGLVLDAGETGGMFQEFKAMVDQGLDFPTNKVWREVQVARSQVKPDEKGGGIQVVDGVKYGVEDVEGVKVMIPV